MKRGRPGNATVGLMTLGFLGFVATWPFIISKRHSSITSSSKEKLPGNLTMRGQYLNTGSNDIGAHPDWDWNTMTLKENQRGAVHIVTTQDEGDGKSGEGRE